MYHYTGDDPLHDRPRPVAPADVLYRLQSLHGRALRCEREAAEAHDSAGVRAAHAVVMRIDALLWPVTA